MQLRDSDMQMIRICTMFSMAEAEVGRMREAMARLETENEALKKAVAELKAVAAASDTSDSSGASPQA